MLSKFSFLFIKPIYKTSSCIPLVFRLDISPVRLIVGILEKSPLIFLGEEPDYVSAFPTFISFSKDFLIALFFISKSICGGKTGRTLR